MIPEDQSTPTTWDGLIASWSLQPRASYRIGARVISAKKYTWDWESFVAPVDLALGWADLSDPAADDWITWNQFGRWYYYSLRDDSPYTLGYIKDHSANVHLIPASENISAAIRQLEKDDLVLLEGMLVDVDARIGGMTFQAKTSLSRTDSGAGGCEIIYVERLVVGGKEYR